MNGTLGVVLVLILLLVVTLLLPVLELVVMVALELMLVVMVLLLLLLLDVGADEGAMAMSAPVNPGTAILARIHPNRLCKSFQFPRSRLSATDL